MTPQAILAFFAAGLSVVLAIGVLALGLRILSNRVFAGGILILAVEQVILGLSYDALLASEILRWQHLRLNLMALAPGLWVAFSLTYARINYWDFLRRWRWILLGIFALPLLLVTIGSNSLLINAIVDEEARWVLPLGTSGYLLHLIFLLSAILVLVNLESTLRASTGSMRWRMKFMLLGVGALFAVQLYIVSQALLYSSIQTNLFPISSAALILADILIIVALVRTRLIHVDVYPSTTFLYNSLTILIVGIYLLVVGALAELVRAIGGEQSLPLTAFIVFLTLLALAMVLLSGEAQERLKRFLNRRLKRPKHDYRNVWSKFTDRTSTLVDHRTLSTAIATIVSETFGTPAVTVWILNETGDKLMVAGSTALTEEQGEELLERIDGGLHIIDAMKGYDEPIDLASQQKVDEGFMKGVEIRHAAPLIAGQELLGFLTLSKRVAREPLNSEDLDLLKTIADQAAASLLNLKLSEQLLGAKEMEAFQTLSAFFVHDLKNLASRLSLTLQNLPVHYDDPDFRKDLLKVISQSVDNINSMCTRLRPLSKELELHTVPTDFNKLVASTLDGLEGTISVPIHRELKEVHEVAIDPEQIQKVIVNLVLNAGEATESEGEIQISTESRNGWTVLTVSDTGSGMSREFLARSLFRAFQTTKKRGLGIGLYHCKKIVEAHKGRIEVESTEGEGSTFRVMLPDQRQTWRGDT